MQRLLGPSCFRSDDLLVIEGKGLDAARDFSLMLELPGEHRRVEVEVNTWQGNRLIARLTNSGRLKGGHRYRLVLVDPQGRSVPGPALFIELELCGLGPDQTSTAEPRAALQRLNQAVPGEVTLLTNAQDNDPTGTAAALGYGISERVQLTALGQEILRLSVPAPKTLIEAVDELQAALPNAIVDLNSLYEIQTGPRYYAKHAINWTDDFLRCADGGQDSRIGLIDSGLDQSHPALAEQSIELKSFIDPEKKTDGLDHATGIAALLIGRPGVGTPIGLLPAARLYVAEVFQRDQDGGAARASSFRLSLALNWLAEERLRVVNLSFAGPRNAVFSANLAQASRQGMVLVAAAGNFGAEAPPAFPAAEKTVLAVTAVDSRNRLYSKANQGSYIEFAAPGVDVWTAKTNGGGAYRSGTSFAAPYVTAIVAAEHALNPRQSNGLIVEGIRRSTKDIGYAGRDNKFGWGLVRAPASCRD